MSCLENISRHIPSLPIYSKEMSGKIEKEAGGLNKVVLTRRPQKEDRRSCVYYVTVNNYTWSVTLHFLFYDLDLHGERHHLVGWSLVLLLV